MIEPVEVPPIRSNQSPSRTGLPSISSICFSSRSRNAMVIAPRTPPPSSERMRFGPGPNRCRSRGRIFVTSSVVIAVELSDRYRLAGSIRHSAACNPNGDHPLTRIMQQVSRRQVRMFRVECRL
jgi:hypothetical protein